MSKIKLPTRLTGIEKQPDGSSKFIYTEVLTNFPSVTRLLLQYRSVTRSTAKAEKQFPFAVNLYLHPVVFYFRPEVKKAKRALRVWLKDEQREKVIGHFEGIVLTQIVYSNLLIQAFFEFSLIYAYLNTSKHGKPFSVEKARRTFELAVQESLKLPTNKKQIRSRKAAKKVLDFAFGIESSFLHKTLTMLERGREEGETALTQEKLRLIALKLKPHAIATILFPDYAPDQKTREARLISNLKQRKKAELEQQKAKKKIKK